VISDWNPDGGVAADGDRGGRPYALGPRAEGIGSVLELIGSARMVRHTGDGATERTPFDLT
jgi:hypothetical protein